MKNILLVIGILGVSILTFAAEIQITKSGQVIRAAKELIIAANSDRTELALVRSPDKSHIISKCFLQHNAKPYPRKIEFNSVIVFNHSWLNDRSTYDTIAEVKLGYGVDLKVDTWSMTLADVDKAVVETVGMGAIAHLQNQIQIVVRINQSTNDQRLVCTSAKPISEDVAIKLLVDSGIFSAPSL